MQMVRGKLSLIFSSDGLGGQAFYTRTPETLLWENRDPAEQWQTRIKK
jgi:hypothetical protein